MCWGGGGKKLQQIKVIVSHSFCIVPAAKLVNHMKFRIFPVTGIVCQQKPQSCHTNTVDRVISLVEVVGSRFVPVVFHVCRMFFEAGVKDVFSFHRCRVWLFGVVNNIHEVVHLAVELFWIWNSSGI